MFMFLDQLPTPSDATLVVPIPATVKTKSQLLQTLAKGLNLPSYFGWNWDALEECLCDLSWISFPRHIVLFHEAVPFTEDSSDRLTYLDILKHAAKECRLGQHHELTVVFPATFVLDPESDCGRD